MDRSYILFNTIVYGGLAFVFSTFYAYARIQHLGIWAMMIFIGYIIHDYVTTWFSRMTTAILWGIVGFYCLTNRLLIHYFPHETSRDLLSIIFTIGISLLLENSINMIYGPSSVGISWWDISFPILLGMFILVNGVVFYLFGHTLFSKMMKGVHEKVQVIRSLGVQVSRVQQMLFLGLLLMLALIAGLVLIQSNMRSSDALFYFIKGVGISILVGFGQKQWVFIWALLYVLLEYFMFIYLWRPIMYKESLILILVLFVLICKPSGLFSFWKRYL